MASIGSASSRNSLCPDCFDRLHAPCLPPRRLLRLRLHTYMLLRGGLSISAEWP
jgi:hypothetical protein